MSHEISGIITSFPLQDDLPNVVLVGNYHFIPTEPRWETSFQESVIPPYGKYTKAVRKKIKELSFTGPCAYVETSFFVEGTQFSEVWKNGVLEFGPALSFHGHSQEIYEKLVSEYHGFPIVKESINSSLRLIGIFCREQMDEFDSARLGCYRSNEEILQEYKLKKKTV